MKVATAGVSVPSVLTEPQVTLRLNNKLASLSGTVRVIDQSGERALEIKGRSWFWPSYAFVRDGVEVARMRRKLLSLMPKWVVTGELGAFTVRRMVALGGRRYAVEGGAFDGAKARGSLLDLSFEVERGGRLLAKARGRILTLTDQHDVDIFENDPQSVLFSLVMVGVMQADRRVESSERFEQA